MYLHDIAKENGTVENGTALMTDEAIEQMMDHLADVFEGSGFVFLLKNVTRSINDTWFDAFYEAPEETEMMRALKVGGPETMNVYLKDSIDADGFYCGTGTFAYKAQARGIRDHITVTKTCTGFGDGIRNGDTFPHEVGKSMYPLL